MSTYLEEFGIIESEFLPSIDYFPWDINEDGFSEFNDSEPENSESTQEENEEDEVIYS
jgi:hypothetical protein